MREDFEAATAVRRRHDGSGYDVTLQAGWCIGDKPNGGYLTAVLARAAVAEAEASGAGHPHPLAVSAHFLRAPEVGPATVEVTVLRTGRSASQLQATLRKDDRTCVVSLHTVGRLGAGAPWWDNAPSPTLPPAQECYRLPDLGAGGVPTPLMGRVLEDLDPATLTWRTGAPSGRGELRGWARLADGADWEPLSLLVALDCFPPVTFDLGAAGWVPTLELTCYLRALPAPGPLAVRQRGTLVQDGRIDETCQVWDSSGRLVASSTQLAGLRVPDGPPAGSS